jgi:hypothetical protein
MKITKAESFRVRFAGLAHGQHEGQAAVHRRQHQRADRTHRAAFGGVARPMKIVPSTRKISASGGTSTMMTCGWQIGQPLQLETLVGRAKQGEDHGHRRAIDLRRLFDAR